MQHRQKLGAQAEPRISRFTYGLHHVQLAIPPNAEEHCRGFYVNILGMKEVPKPPLLQARGGLWLAADRLEIHLGVDADFIPARKAHPGIVVADVTKLATRLKEHAVPIEWDDAFPGFKRFYAFDCVGNRLEFMTPLSTGPTISRARDSEAEDSIRYLGGH